jgi:methylglyoxal synthase
MVNKTIALIAHDRRKQDLVEWVEHNALTLIPNKLVCTGTTGGLVEKKLLEYCGKYDIDSSILNIVKYNSGPIGGDAEIASLVVKGEIDLCIFLIDDLSANAHEADIQMLLRQCRVHNIPVACNRHSADLMITSDLWKVNYTPTKPNYSDFKR